MTTRKTIVYGFLAVILVLAFTACSGSGGGGKSLNSAAELKEYLDKQPGNSPDQPIKVAIKANDMMLAEIVGVIKSANKYVSLNLSGSPLTEIPDDAFEDCKTLVGITIPNSVTSIGDYAFSGTGLTSVTIPNSVISIGDGAFSSDVSIDSPNIEGGILYNKTKTEIIYVPRGISGNVTIPNSVTTIEWGAFYYCFDLTSITVDSGNPNYASEGGILYNKAKTEIVFVPRGISGNVTIPNSVTSSIGDFSNRTELTSVTIGSGIIGQNAFAECTNLTSVTIGSGVTRIEFGAFQKSYPTSVTFEGTIRPANFNADALTFPGNLRAKYLAEGIGTYTRSWNGRAHVWTKQ